MLFTWLMINVEFELLEKLRSFYKPQIEFYDQSDGCDQWLLKDVNYG